MIDESFEWVRKLLDFCDREQKYHEYFVKSLVIYEHEQNKVG